MRAGQQKKIGVVAVQNFEPIPRFGCFRRNEHIKQVRVRKPSQTLNLIYSARLSYPIDAIVVTRSLRAIRRARPVHIISNTDLTNFVSVSGFSRVYIRGTF